MASKKTDVPKLTTEEVELYLEEDDLDAISLDMEDALTVEEPMVEERMAEAAFKPPADPLSVLEALITPIDDSVEYLTWVIYGKNGTGKTTLLSTADGVLILAAEDGTLSIRTKAKNARKLKIDSWEKIESIYWLLKNGNYRKDGGIDIKTSTGVFTVKYLAIDTVTKLAEVCMRNVVLGELDKDASKDIIKKTMRDWGDMSEKMKYWLQQFEELPLQRVW
ncbi:MAG: hypothetical protein EOM67_15915, partial [Spirochaetia bacterium]|nr:hypothetical protein [Spirochaetia bacterium]